MIGAGTFLNPLLKVVTTVAIITAIYFFMVRPIRDTTEDISGGITHSVNKGLNQAAKAQKQADKLLKCVQDAGGDVDKIQACNAIVAN